MHTDCLSVPTVTSLQGHTKGQKVTNIYANVTNFFASHKYKSFWGLLDLLPFFPICPKVDILVSDIVKDPKGLFTHICLYGNFDVKLRLF